MNVKRWQKTAALGGCFRHPFNEGSELLSKGSIPSCPFRVPLKPGACVQLKKRFASSLGSELS